MRNEVQTGKMQIAILCLMAVLFWAGCGEVPKVKPTPGVIDVIEMPTLLPDTPLPDPTGTQPSLFLGEINPLTGLPASQAELLNRRPILVKIENLPRDHRPQFGLAQADLVYEYHTEEGTTRFAALFYGQNAEKVGPIRSARFFDVNLMRMYKPIFIFGSAYKKLLSFLFEQDFSDRLILEGPNTAPALYRYEPEGRNLLMVNTHDLQGVITKYDINNERPNLAGMVFDSVLPSGGEAGTMIFVRFSSAIYNRWDYDAASGRYLRHYDFDNATETAAEQYTLAVDPASGQPLAVDNVVVLQAKNFVVDPGVYDIELMGEGDAALARDGQIYSIKWQRKNEEDILSFMNLDGTPFPFKPGQTWFEVMSKPTDIEKTESSWRFTFRVPE
jgi:hypothetical protein